MSDVNENPDAGRESALLSWIQLHATYGVLTLDKLLNIQSWNHWMETHSGKSYQEVAGKNIFAIFPDLVERKLAGHFERAAQGESSVVSTSLHRYLIPLPSSLRRHGEKYMRQTGRITPLLSNGKVFGVVVVIEDVTQREAQAEALTKQHRRDEILSWALAHLLKSSEPRKTVRQLFFKIAEHLDFDTFFLYLRNIETDELELYMSGGIPPELEKDFSSYKFISALADSEEMVVFDSVKDRTSTDFELLKRAGISAAVAIPLFTNERKLGLLCFGTWSRPTIAPDESTLLLTIAQYLASAVETENTAYQLQKARKLLLDHAQNLERTVIERTARLQEIISEQETFSYTLAHDLKAPLRGLAGYSKIIMEDFSAKIPTAAVVHLEKISSISRRMEILIRDILEFSKISRKEIVPVPVEIGPIIEDLVALRVPSVRRSINVRMPLHKILGHQALLQNVLSNLVDNAIKFALPGQGPKISIFSEVVTHTSPSIHSKQLLFSSHELAEAETLVSSAEAAAKLVRVWVVDQGMGIPASSHRKIFGIFERGPQSENIEGTGMGLAIVARAIQRMGGTCGVESEPGKGSKFWIELPSA